eukprot:117498_1
MADEKSADLKTWMRKQDIYDNDLYDILISQGVESPEEHFKDYTQKQWDVLWRKGCVERAKELKDQKAKVRLEKKMKKLEKFWRKQSGIKSTSIKKSKKSDAKPLENSAQAQNDALTQGKDLKKYLQKNQCFMTDLVIVCVGMGICSEADIEKIEDNSTFEEIFRQVRVARAKDLKDNASRIRMEKTVTKFEKLWRKKTGVEKTSIKKGKKGGKKKKKDPKSARNEDMATGGATLKKWMKKENVWEIALYDELMANNINDPEALKEIDEETFDNIVRKVRVDRFSQLKDQNSRNRADKLLIKFEKIWRKASGNKKTSIK